MAGDIVSGAIAVNLCGVTVETRDLEPDGFWRPVATWNTSFNAKLRGLHALAA